MSVSVNSQKFKAPCLCLSTVVPDMSFEDSDTSSMLSTNSPRGTIQSSPIPIPVETHHASLRRKKGEKGEASPAVERSQSLQADMTHRPLSMVVPSQSDANMSLSPSISSLNRQVCLVVQMRDHTCSFCQVALSQSPRRNAGDV